MTSTKNESQFKDWQEIKVPDIPEGLRVPQSLVGCWEREYIKQSFREARATDVDGQGRTWYLQLQNGLCVDCRIDLRHLGNGESGSITPTHDCFFGVTLFSGDEGIANWHPMMIFSMDAASSEDASGCGTSSSDRVTDHCIKALQKPTETEDRGRVSWIEHNNVWLETDVDGGSAVLEERWCRVDDIVGGNKQPLLEGSWYRQREMEGSNEIISEYFLACRNHFAHVLVVPSGGNVFSMGILNESPLSSSGQTLQAIIKISTSKTKFGQLVENIPTML